MIVKMPCTFCGWPVEFEAETAGQETTCAHCSKPIILRVVSRKNYPTHLLRGDGWKWKPVIIVGGVIAATALTIAIVSKFSQDAAEMIGGIIIVSALVCVYFLPTIVARKKRNSGAIFILNVFLGWTFVGWVVALVWAATKDSER